MRKMKKMRKKVAPRAPAVPPARPWVVPAGSLCLTVHARVTPGAPRDEIVGPDGARGELRLKVTAPPEGGRANAAVEDLIASRLGVKKGMVRIVTGHTSRSKRVEVRCDFSAEEAARRLLQ